MTKKKDDSEKESVVITYTLLPYFAVESDSPRLSGIRGVGETPIIAIQHLMGQIHKLYPKSNYKLIEKLANPEFAQGWRMPEPHERGD